MISARRERALSRSDLPSRQPAGRRLLKWLYPGMNVKRWLLLIFLGAAIVSVGVAVASGAQDLSFGLLRFISRHAPFLSGLFIENRLVGTFLGLVGTAAILFGVRQMVRSIGAAVVPQDRELVDVIFEKRHLEHGPRITAIGGGTGLSTLLRGLKSRTSNLTAVVTVADDGGSSGRLRESGMPPPGDIRNCIAALADVEPLMTQLFQHRFHGLGDGLDGHSFGNLFIAAMTHITGDFEQAVKETSKVLAIRGKVLPATVENVRLGARLQDGREIHGQVAVNLTPAPIAEAFLEPASPPGLKESVDAIFQADAIVIGPGSLFSSIIPNLLVGDINAALRKSRALKIYVCNVMTQPNETLNYSAYEHVSALLRYLGENILDYVLINTQLPSKPSLERYEHKGARFVVPDVERIEALGVKVITGDWVSEESYVRHDSKKLADAIFKIVEDVRQ